MISKSLEVFSKSVGLNIAEECIYGIYGGFFMTVSERRSSKNVEISCYIGSSDEYYEDYASINDGIRDVLDKYLISDYSVNENSLSVTSHAELSLFREMIDYLAGMLDELDIYNSDYCSECGEKIDSKRIVTISCGKDCHKRLVCDSCALSLAEAEHKHEEPKAEKSERFLRGMIASICGGVIGCGVYILIFYFTGVNGHDSMTRFAPCLAALLIGALATIAYKREAGRFSAKGIVCFCSVTGVFTIIAHFSGCIFGYVKYLYNDKGIPVSASYRAFSSVVKLQFTDPKNLSFLIIGCVISLCCAFICVIFIYGLYIKKNSKSNKITVSVSSVK